MDLSTFIFYFLTFIVISSAATVVLLPNPIHSALSLAITMVGLGLIYFNLEAYFIAGVQLIVYAGAVMVLFVMVLMLFDLKSETESFSGHRFVITLKVLSVTALAGFIGWAIRESILAAPAKGTKMNSAEQMAQIKLLAEKLFTQYLFAFESLGILLLLIAVGVVAVARSRGGTHARD